jgi:F-box-like
MTAIEDTFESFGVLEHILSYVSARDLLTATEVSRRFKVAGRSDFLWEEACHSLWKGRKGMRECDANVSYKVR